MAHCLYDFMSSRIRREGVGLSVKQKAAPYLKGRAADP